MGTFSLSGGVEVVGFISPTDPLDTYAVIDPLYGIDGFRNVDTLTDLNNISTLRRRAGMVVGVSGGTIYYKLKPSPWSGTITDWDIFQTGGGGDFSGGTVTGDTIFLGGVTANTFNVNKIGDSADCVDDLYIANLHGCVTGVTLHDNVVPVTNETIDLGTSITRFREINTLSGNSSYWTSTVKVITPQLDLGLDGDSNSRIITANNSVIQNDILFGGSF